MVSPTYLLVHLHIVSSESSFYPFIHSYHKIRCDCIAFTQSFSLKVCSFFYSPFPLSFIYLLRINNALHNFKLNVLKFPPSLLYFVISSVNIATGLIAVLYTHFNGFTALILEYESFMSLICTMIFPTTLI